MPSFLVRSWLLTWAIMGLISAGCPGTHSEFLDWVFSSAPELDHCGGDTAPYGSTVFHRCEWWRVNIRDQYCRLRMVKNNRHLSRISRFWQINRAETFARASHIRPIGTAWPTCPISSQSYTVVGSFFWSLDHAFIQVWKDVCIAMARSLSYRQFVPKTSKSEHVPQFKRP